MMMLAALFMSPWHKPGSLCGRKESCDDELLLCAGPEAWQAYFRMFDESRFVHVTSLDFCFLTLLAPFWVLNDASKRQWSQR